jgi:hypothetical protein
MDAVDEYCADELAEQFTAEAVLFAGGRAMDAQDGLELFEEQLDLPAQRIQRPNHGQRQPPLWNIGDQ